MAEAGNKKRCRHKQVLEQTFEKEEVAKEEKCVWNQRTEQLLVLLFPRLQIEKDGNDFDSSGHSSLRESSVLFCSLRSKVR